MPVRKCAISGWRRPNWSSGRPIRRTRSTWFRSRRAIRSCWRRRTAGSAGRSSQLKRYRVTNVEVNDISREVGAMMDNIGAISLTKGIPFDVEGTPGDTTLVCVVTPRDSALPVDRETLIRWLRIRTKVENVKLFVEP